jgi:hypothetical protein
VSWLTNKENDSITLPEIKNERRVAAHGFVGIKAAGFKSDFNSTGTY